MLGCVDLLGLLDGSMVQPQNHIVIVHRLVETGTGHRHGLIRVVGEYRERARRVEADAPDGVRVDVVLSDGAVDRGTDTSPDVGGGLFLSSKRSLDIHTNKSLEVSFFFRVHNTPSEVAIDQCSQRTGRQCHRFH